MYKAQWEIGLKQIKQCISSIFEKDFIFPLNLNNLYHQIGSRKTYVVILVFILF